MPHLRLNETEPNPNPHINFISALPMPDLKFQEEARQLLRALAAQVRPVMKAHGFAINSFEEYEYNTVFAGRNWNNGETVELVLRNANGLYYPTSWLMSTLCHEVCPSLILRYLSKNAMVSKVDKLKKTLKHMNHGPAFQALWTRLRREVRQLQDKGYYGDGYWSSGTRLADSARVSNDGIQLETFPEYMCGGAQTRAKPTSLRRRRTSKKRRETVPSLHTGRQTAKRRKAGGRVTSKFAFVGEGKSLADDASTSKGKRAASNRAREERALAAERRLNAHLTQSKDGKQTSDEDSASDSEVEFVQETDAERRQALFNSETMTGKDDKQGLGKNLHWQDFEAEFRFNPSPRQGRDPPTAEPHAGYSKLTRSGSPEVIELSDELDEDHDRCDIPVASGSTFTTNTHQNPKGKQKPNVPSESGSSYNRSTKTDRLAIGKLVQSEIEFRKKEALGLGPSNGNNRTLGESPKANKPRRLEENRVHAGTRDTNSLKNPTASNSSPAPHWNCLVCTLWVFLTYYFWQKTHKKIEKISQTTWPA